MSRDRRRSLFGYAAAVLVLFLITVCVGTIFINQYGRIRKEEANRLLAMYQENITLTLQRQLNYAQSLADLELDAPGHMQWLEWKAQEFLEEEAVRAIYIFKGNKVQEVYPQAGNESLIGRDLRDFSYLFTMAKVLKEPVVEGPISLSGIDGNVFLFLEPLVENGAYKGEAAVAIDEKYVMERLNLDRIQELGYEYHLWKMDSQDGSKDVIAASKTGMDFSHAIKAEFYTPVQWTLSIIPKAGWVPFHVQCGILGTAAIFGLLLSALLFSTAGLLQRRRTMRRLSDTDWQSGMYNRKGFCRELNQWIGEPDAAFSLFYYYIEEFERASLAAGSEIEEGYLKTIPVLIEEYLKGPYIAGRLGEGSFVIAVRENMSGQERSDFAKGLSLRMMWKTHLNGQKLFLNAQYQYVSYPEDGVSAEELLKKLTGDYFRRFVQEAPVRDLTQKCRRLINGETDVEFSGYQDIPMTELAKTINQYRKQVEQVAYIDQAYGIGNRMKYLRDTQLLIAYDEKRRFRLYGVDIRSFGKYNELFSVRTGDALLLEMTRRLKEIFGSSLYRINGDVFVGISFDETYKEYQKDGVVQRIKSALKRPIELKDTVFTLEAYIGICDYSIHAKTPEKLLECVQSAISYAKVPKNGIADGVMVYNEAMRELNSREGQILRLLKTAISEEKLEVWYQPIYKIREKRFAAVEALVRLRDEAGGYIPTAQMIDIAERNGIVNQVGEYVMGCACSFMQENASMLELETMGINLSAQQLLLENSASRILEQIKHTGVDPRSITLEITETVLIQSIEKAEGILRELAGHGIRIALDDFGVGYSSLNYLMNLPVDALKIDRSMTKMITSSDKQYALLQAVIDMADMNHMNIVVEGVETEEELKRVSSTTAAYIQGFYYSKPLPEDNLIEFLLERTRP